MALICRKTGANRRKIYARAAVIGINLAAG
jgi:hypothetical protein